MIKTDKGYRGLDRTRQVWRIFCHGMQGSLALPVRICSLTCLHTTVLTATAATLGSGFLDRCVSTFTRFTSGSRPWFIVQDDRFLGSSWVLQVCSSSSGFSVTMCDGVWRSKSLSNLAQFCRCVSDSNSDQVAWEICALKCRCKLELVKSSCPPGNMKFCTDPGKVSWEVWRHGRGHSHLTYRCHTETIWNTTVHYSTLRCTWLIIHTVSISFSCFRPVPPQRSSVGQNWDPFLTFQNSVQNWKWLLLSANPVSISALRMRRLRQKLKSYTGTLGFDRSILLRDPCIAVVKPFLGPTQGSNIKSPVNIRASVLMIIDLPIWFYRTHFLV